MRIALIITGGTILSEEQAGCYCLSDKRQTEILELLPPDVEAEVFSKYIILSEQLDGEYLTSLINLVGDKLQEGYDGLLILHGTDTLQYSAAALSLAYGDSDIPIVLVSSNYVLYDERSNGRDNLRYALKFIQENFGGVFVSYKNTGESPAIFLGDTLLPHMTYSDKLYSTDGVFGYFENDRFLKQKEKPQPHAIGRYALDKYSPVLYIKAYAGMTMPSAKNYRAVLIETFHSGTLPSENENFIRFCKSCDKPIYIVGVSEGIKYSSVKNYDELGLRILPPISPIFAYITLWREYSSDVL